MHETEHTTKLAAHDVTTTKHIIETAVSKMNVAVHSMRTSRRRLNIVVVYVIAVGMKTNKRGVSCVLHSGWTIRCFFGNDDDKCHSLLTTVLATVMVNV